MGILYYRKEGISLINNLSRETPFNISLSLINALILLLDRTRGFSVFILILLFQLPIYFASSLTVL